MHFSGDFGGFRAGAASGAGRRQRGVFRRISGVLKRFCNRLFLLFMRVRRRFFASRCNFRAQEGRIFRENRRAAASHGVRSAAVASGVPAARRSRGENFFQKVSAECFADSHFRRRAFVHAGCGDAKQKHEIRALRTLCARCVRRSRCASRCGVRRSCCAFLAEKETKKPARAFPFPRACVVQCFLFPVERATPRPTKFYSSKNGGARKL